LKRIVVDTGVIVSALLKKEGTSRVAFIKAVIECIPLLALSTLDELGKTLCKPKFKSFFSSEERIAITELLLRKGEYIEITSTTAACRDSSDNQFLNLALDGKADLILTRDNDLLTLHPFRGIPILLPADFLKLF
jgi:uncharacterized protein